MCMYFAFQPVQADRLIIAPEETYDLIVTIRVYYVK